MTRLVRVAELRVGDTIWMRHRDPVTVDELVGLGDGKVLVRWCRWSDQGLMKRRRHMWKHPRDVDGKPRRTRYSIGALKTINEAIDGRELGSLIPLERDELVRVAREEETPMDASVPEVVDVEVDDEPGMAVTLFQTNDPKVALARMTEHAKLLVDVVRQRKLSTRIGNSEHLRVEAWLCLGGMLGIQPIVVWTKPNETGDGFVARVEARTLDGRVVGAAEAECSRSESTWAKRPPYALRSMSQTRATSRALRAPLGALVTLAGYETAAVEEMPTLPQARAPARPAVRKPPSKVQAAAITELIRRLEELVPEQDWRAYCRTYVDGAPGGMSHEDAARLIGELEGRIEEIVDE